MANERYHCKRGIGRSLVGLVAWDEDQILVNLLVIKARVTTVR